MWFKSVIVAYCVGNYSGRPMWHILVDYNDERTSCLSHVDFLCFTMLLLIIHNLRLKLVVLRWRFDYNVENVPHLMTPQFYVRHIFPVDTVVWYV